MHLTRICDAVQYTAARHSGVCALRLQGAEVSPAAGFWCGLSYYLPGARAEESAGAAERVYVCLEGNLTVRCEAAEEVLGPLDSCHVAVGERRSIENTSNKVATLLVIVGAEKASGR